MSGRDRDDLDGVNYDALDEERARAERAKRIDDGLARKLSLNMDRQAMKLAAEKAEEAAERAREAMDACVHAIVVDRNDEVGRVCWDCFDRLQDALRLNVASVHREDPEQIQKAIASGRCACCGAQR
jgi:hypothetical protein